MTSIFLQRSIIIFVIFLCCFQTWVNAFDCENYPYSPPCRGMQSKKRTMLPNPYLSNVDCINDDDCKLNRLKLLVAIVNTIPDKDESSLMSDDIRYKYGKSKSINQRSNIDNFITKFANDYYFSK